MDSFLFSTQLSLFFVLEHALAPVLHEAAPLVQASLFYFSSCFFFYRPSLHFLLDLLVSVGLMCRCIPRWQVSTPALSPIFLDLSHSGGQWFMRFVRFFSRRVFSFVLTDSVLAPQWPVGLCRVHPGLVVFLRLRSFRSVLLPPGVPGINTTG
jgi:hypothetical protein